MSNYIVFQNSMTFSVVGFRKMLLLATPKNDPPTLKCTFEMAPRNLLLFLGYTPCFLVISHTFEIVANNASRPGWP